MPIRDARLLLRNRTEQFESGNATQPAGLIPGCGEKVAPATGCAEFVPKRAIQGSDNQSRTGFAECISFTCDVMSFISQYLAEMSIRCPARNDTRKVLFESLCISLCKRAHLLS